MRARRPPLTDEQRAYTRIYAWGVAWVVLYAILTPPQAALIFATASLYLWNGIAVCAGLAALYGLRTGSHLVLERQALRLFRYVLLAYPLTTLVVAILELQTTGMSSRWHLLLLGTWPFVFLGKRARFLQRKYAEARATPLPSEEA